MFKGMFTVAIVSMSVALATSVVAAPNARTSATPKAKDDAAVKVVKKADKDVSEKVKQLKDDGTCWAVTEKGSRCKMKKVGESDYCRIHAADKKPSKSVDKCRALKYDGERCSRKPVDGSMYCEQHRKLGKVTAPVK